MPNWPTDINQIGSISSIIGLIVTVFLFFEARSIKNSFIRRARLPEVNRELLKFTSQLSERLKNWESQKTEAIETFSQIKALLQNIKPKLPSEEKRKVDEYLQKLHPKRYLIIEGSLSDLTEDDAWDRYTELSGLVTTLQQLAKDSKWD
ncbi:hypothetical protein [Pseudoalteromonas sp. OOF1S-7]|uniref:hypothetical protein n=1 Tax=Pseudoalteromonas sp. OOF1S-7 TaxID=2917757 RepID=UPI001EF3F30F|nr:hypothetical protein [Pseudoalteromonas sp. OOF1S-7]MCG7537287.1 hypothetical protein [Pseudoalteromonas sp. OOF1S-7]